MIECANPNVFGSGGRGGGGGRIATAFIGKTSVDPRFPCMPSTLCCKNLGKSSLSLLSLLFKAIFGSGGRGGGGGGGGAI